VALEREPALPRLLGGYVLMGGAYGSPGNTTPTSEWNIHVDPHAAKRVFEHWAKPGAGAWRSDETPGAGQAPLPLALGLNVTEQARLRPEHLRHLAVRADALPLDAAGLGAEPVEAVGTVAANPILRFIADALRFYFEFHAKYDGFYGAFIHDPLAVAAAIDRTLVESTPTFVDVETGPGLAHGMTIADFRGLTRHSPNVDVVVDADIDRFLDRLVERVGGLAARLPVAARHLA
jgi:purine nucleosidase